MKTQIRQTINPRELAHRALLEFQRTRRPPDEILDRLFQQDISEQDKSLAWEITMGSIRYLKRLDFIAQTYVKAPLSAQKPEIIAGLRIGLYQLTEIANIPQFAAVHETVRLFSNRLLNRDAGFVNAVFRSYLREPERVIYPNPEIDPVAYLATFYSYPEWLVRRWLTAHGYEETSKILMANNNRPKTSFKIIGHKSEIDEVFNGLKDNGLDVEKSRYFPDYISSDAGSAVIKTDIFKNGNLIVQDESQGLPIYLLNPPNGATVLDLCSAPGGKTIALADKVGPEGKVISLDIDKNRLEQVRQNATKTGLKNIEFVHEDLLKFAPSEKFKYILLDVPCSALGTLSRNVDLKWTRTENDIRAFSRMQLAMLNKASEQLDDGGHLVYSTCTTEPEEIEEVIKGFLMSQPSFAVERDESGALNPFEEPSGIYRTWPHTHGIGGGGFALLKRKYG
jgi:16S rRNA (cytosine967-C5)-methyltransferase